MAKTARTMNHNLCNGAIKLPLIDCSVYNLIYKVDYLVEFSYGCNHRNRVLVVEKDYFNEKLTIREKHTSHSRIHSVLQEPVQLMVRMAVLNFYEILRLKSGT